MPPVAKTGTMDIFKSDELFREGKVAMNIDWIGLGEASLDPKTSKVSDKLVFGQMPGTMGADGKMIRWSNIGGQPFVLTTWTTDIPDQGSRRLREVVAVHRDPAPVRGGRRPVGHEGRVRGSEVRDLSSVEPRLGSSLDWQKDVWHVPQFFELLTQQQDQFDLAITGKQDAKTTLDNIAKFQQDLLKEAGLIE